MPELPEVETVVRGLRRAGLEGGRITGCEVAWPRTVTGRSPESFRQAVCGLRIEAVSRRGKYVVVRLSDGLWMLIHLRMSGSLWVVAREQAAPSHVRMSLALDDGRRLLFRDPRKFGRCTLTADPSAALSALGPEPLSADFSLSWMTRALHRRSRRLKPLLLDQSFVAGIGNIYADESLWRARLHPLRSADSLTPPEVSRLHKAIRQALKAGIAASGTTLGRGPSNFRNPEGNHGRNQNRLNVFRRTGEPCPRCKTPVRRLIVGQRSTHICPVCQPSPSGGSHSRNTRRAAPPKA